MLTDVTPKPLSPSSQVFAVRTLCSGLVKLVSGFLHFLYNLDPTPQFLGYTICLFYNAMRIGFVLQKNCRFKMHPCIQRKVCCNMHVIQAVVLTLEIGRVKTSCCTLQCTRCMSALCQSPTNLQSNCY